MKKTRGFLLTAGIALATAFTFSCSGDDGEPSGGGYLSCTQARGVIDNCSAYSDEQKDECRTQGLCGGNSRDVCVAHYQSECPELFGNPPDLGPGGVNLSELSNKQVYFVEFARRNESDDDIYAKIGTFTGNVDVFLDVEYVTDEELWEHDFFLVGKIQNGKLSLDSLPSLGSKYSNTFRHNAYSEATFSVDIPGKDCYISAYMAKQDEWFYIHPIYSLVSEYGLSEGWNFLYGGAFSLLAGATFEWGLSCYED